MSKSVSKQLEIGALSALTITQVLADLITTQQKSFISSLKAAYKKSQKTKIEKLKLIILGLKHLAPHIRSLKHKAFHQWKHNQKLKLIIHKQFSSAFSRLERIVRKDQYRHQEKFWISCQVFSILKTKQIKLIVRRLKEKTCVAYRL